MKTLWRLCLFLALVQGHKGYAQQSSPPSVPQPLNATVSDFGTSFVFSPPLICAGCMETELGLLALEGGRYLPALLSYAPFSTHTDFNILVNLLESEKTDGRRTTHFGSRWDFVVRQQLLQRGGWLLSVAPRGAILTGAMAGGRAGGTFAAEYGKGNNLAVINLTYTSAIRSSAQNPKNDCQGSLDYYRTLSPKGYAAFTGFQHEVSTSNPQPVSTEEGLIIPFRNGQVELATQQLSLNTHPTLQFQTRVIVNWGKLIRR